MSKLTVADIENRLLQRIFKSIGVLPPFGGAFLEDTLISLFNKQEMKIIRLEGQLSVYQSIGTNAKYPAPASPPVEQKYR